MPMRLAGTLNVSDFTINAGETATLGGGLTVEATGDITIMGKLVTDAHTPDGSGVRLHTSGGTIMIGGDVASANGKSSWPPPPRATQVQGVGGGDGGAIELVADAGYIVILSTARIRAGAGGRGVDTYAEGTGAVPLVSAISGGGGSGGAITITSSDLVVIEGEVTGGDGGSGGLAEATGHPDRGGAGSGNNPGGPGTPGSDLPPASAPGAGVALIPSVVEATGSKGGPGGDIAIATSGPLGVLTLKGKVHGGPGGSSAGANATGGHSAQALLKEGGRGGNVGITFNDSTMLIQYTGDGEVGGGTGGDTGDLSALKKGLLDDPDPIPVPGGGGGPAPPPLLPPLRIDGADADGSERALAWVGDPVQPGFAAAGAAGSVSAVNVVPDPIPGKPKLTLPMTLINEKPADAGDTTDADARVGALHKHERGTNHVKKQPGTAAKAELP